MIGASVMQINIFIDMAFASALPIGSISYLNCADRINQLPLSLLGAALGTTLLPSLAKFWSNNDYVQAHKTQSKAFIFSLFLVIPAAVGIFTLAERIVSFLYEHGKFDHSAVIQTMSALKAFVIGLPAYVISKVFLAIFFANKDTKTPVVVASICVLVNVVLNYVLRIHFAHVGIAIATATSSWVNIIIGFFVLSHRKLLKIGKTEIKSAVGIIAASVLMGLFVYFLSFFLLEKFQLRNFVNLIVSILAGITLYFSLTYPLKVKF
jgi:putative peptidoglycan lipid II flippase